MKSSFQNGVDSIYNKCVSCGSTPNSKTPTACNTAIQTIYNNRYTTGYSNGVIAGSDKKTKSVTINVNLISDQGKTITTSFSFGNGYKGLLSYSVTGNIYSSSMTRYDYSLISNGWIITGGSLSINVNITPLGTDSIAKGTMTFKLDYY